MKLFKILLAYGYKFERRFTFLTIAENVLEAEVMAIETFNKYSYGNCQLHSIEILGGEGQYAEPNILLISKKLAKVST